MQKIIILLYFLVPSLGFSQNTILPIDSATGLVTYSEVISVDSVSAVELYRRAKIWFVESYGSGKDVIQNDDQLTNTLQGKGIFTTVYWVGNSEYQWGNISYVLSIVSKNGRYKYSFSNFFHTYVGYPDFSIGVISNSMTAKGKAVRC